ncbi:YybH family protein [Blastococcus haudaquaticus]|uniref:YybH family protein n=1 Tax=Blastococcus haudaquaticus TaxID=1938745 RepID=UPI0013598D4F|nr:nuclear transport factor 2 family protein [Blastococcus haudaquaticus]
MDADEFLAEVLHLMVDEVVGVHDGDPTARMALWSHVEPVTLFGAEMTRRGWGQLEPAFRWLAGTFTGSGSCEYEVLSAGSSGDLGYVVAIEHSVASRRGAPARKYALRVTTLFRREGGEWKVVHRHGDGYGESNALPSDG